MNVFVYFKTEIAPELLQKERITEYTLETHRRVYKPIRYPLVCLSLLNL
jgi:hypothetical protein